MRTKEDYIKMIPVVYDLCENKYWTFGEACEHLGLDKWIMAKHYKQHGYTIIKRGKREKFFFEWKKLSEQGVTISEIARRYNTTPKVVRSIFKKYGYQYETNMSVIKRKYPFREDYFENIDSPNKAIWLGVILSDGNLFYDKKNSCYRISIKFWDRDREYLELFRRELETEKPIYECKNGAVEFSVYSKKMYEDLVRLGITERKSYTATFPKVSKEFYRPVIQGIFEGDGSIGIYERQAYFTITGTYELLDQIQDIMAEEIGINKRKLIQIKGSQNLWNLVYGGNNQVKNIGEWLYKDTPFYMKRKRDIFLELGCDI